MAAARDPSCGKTTGLEALDLSAGGGGETGLSLNLSGPPVALGADVTSVAATEPWGLLEGH